MSNNIGLLDHVFGKSLYKSTFFCFALMQDLWARRKLIAFTSVVLVALIAMDLYTRRPTPALTQSFDSSAMPESEVAFINIVKDYQRRSDKAQSEIQLAELLGKRAAELRGLNLDGEIVNWTGEVQDASASRDGRGVLSIGIAPGISFGTWNNAQSDNGRNTLIPVTSGLYARLDRLKIGDRVIFSGTIFPSGQVGFQEKSMTLRGSLASPEFLIRFSDQTARNVR
ncbi:MAG: hypothetical protein JNM45_11900 [Rhizobiales bacterium]|nr:hypothetical protein [Hyphomicrobiales bacterium]